MSKNTIIMATRPKNGKMAEAKKIAHYPLRFWKKQSYIDYAILTMIYENFPLDIRPVADFTAIFSILVGEYGRKCERTWLSVAKMHLYHTETLIHQLCNPHDDLWKFSSWYQACGRFYSHFFDFSWQKWPKMWKNLAKCCQDAPACTYIIRKLSETNEGCFPM